MEYQEPINHQVELYDDQDDNDDPISGDPKKRFNIIVIPGNKRLGSEIFKYRRELGGIIFVIDSVNPNIKLSAEYLIKYNIDGYMIC